MPLDILGRTRATMACAESLFELRPRTASRLVGDGGNSVFGRRPSGLGNGARETVVERLRQS